MSCQCLKVHLETKWLFLWSLNYFFRFTLFCHSIFFTLDVICFINVTWYRNIIHSPCFAFGSITGLLSLCFLGLKVECEAILRGLLDLEKWDLIDCYNSPWLAIPVICESCNFKNICPKADSDALSSRQVLNLSTFVLCVAYPSASIERKWVLCQPSWKAWIPFSMSASQTLICYASPGDLVKVQISVY